MRKPRKLGTAGTHLWDDVNAEFELSDPEQALLEQACRISDTIATLDKVVEDEGLTVASSQGVKAHPLIVEARAQRLAFARVMAAVKIPALSDEPNRGK